MRILCVHLWGHPGCLGGIETFDRNLKKFFYEDLYFFTYTTKKRNIMKLQI